MDLFNRMMERVTVYLDIQFNASFTNLPILYLLQTQERLYFQGDTMGAFTGSGLKSVEKLLFSLLMPGGNERSYMLKKTCR